MRTCVRSIGALLVAGVLVAACAASATPSPAASSAPPATVVPTQAPTASPTKPADPTAAPPASVEPMAPAYVTGGESIQSLDQGTTTTDGDVSKIRGVVVKAIDSMDDPRVSGAWTVHLSVDAIGTIGFEWGTSEMTNAGGSWAGTCSGGAWETGNASDMTCWAVGSGGYAGLTYWYHLASSGTTGTVDGVLLPLPAPTP